MTSTVFVPDCLRTDRTTVGTASLLAARSASSSLSSTVATSPMRTGRPLRWVMKMASNSFAFATRPYTRTVASFAPLLSVPPGIFTFCVWSARRTSTAVRA